ncbi:MAG: L-threonylcarbamoyladenylate synthase [Flavobacteriaceae bacterium]|nr:L-threonylcarbamoyladenylate synthase [Flavobacteriaceae bacterium]
MEEIMQQEIQNTLDTLKEGKIIIYPTDTIWGIGCDATNVDAVQQIYDINQRKEQEGMIILMDSIQMLHKYIPEVPEVAYDIIEESEDPITIILDNPRGLAKNLITQDNSIAIRIPKNEFLLKLIQKFRKPIVATSAHVNGDKIPMIYAEINPKLLNQVDYVVNLEREKVSTKLSSIIKLKSSGQVFIIRK